MMKNRPGEKIKLASLDELLGVVNEESAMEIEINKIHAFKNHPFKVLDDEKMQDLIESVKLSGVLTPVLLRVDSNDEYEMISGHRRLHAAKMAGLTTIPAIVRELSDDDAVIAMVDAILDAADPMRDHDARDQRRDAESGCELLLEFGVVRGNAPAVRGGKRSHAIKSFVARYGGHAR